MDEDVIVVGLGNALRGDDAAGLRVAELLAERGVDAVRHEGEPVELLETLASKPRVVLVDAVVGERPGRVWRFDASAGELPLSFERRSSTHLVGLAETIELARALGRMPDRLEVIAIEGSRFALGSEPAAAVAAAAQAVADGLASAG